MNSNNFEKHKNLGGFPKGFLWGSATSSHQVEGGTRNDWSEWEKQNAERLAQEAEKKFNHLSNWTDIKAQAQNPANYISGRACDHYNRYEEDFDIAQSLGHNVHRFSIEWSRIEPEEGKWDEKEIEHYRKVIRALHELGMEPFVTLWHWCIPLWMRDKGGVTSKEFPRYFARYAERMAQELGNDVKFWMTLNEPTSVIINSFMLGVWPPQKKSVFFTLRAYKTLAQAHREAYYAIRAVQKNAQIGFGNILKFCEPMRKNFFDGLIARIADFWLNRYFLKLTGDTHDYYALQYYFHMRIAFPGKIKNENERLSDLGWELYPEGIYHLLKRPEYSKKPVYITENGLADARDAQREWFIKEHLRWVHKAMQEGVDVRGYFYWSLLDNFEWDKGFWPRFGLVEIDYKTLERKIRPSAHEYAKIIKSNSLES